MLSGAFSIALDEPLRLSWDAALAAFWASMAVCEALAPPASWCAGGAQAAAWVEGFASCAASVNSTWELFSLATKKKEEHIRLNPKGGSYEPVQMSRHVSKTLRRNNTMWDWLNNLLWSCRCRASSFTSGLQPAKKEMWLWDIENVTLRELPITRNTNHTFISSQYFTTEDILE